MQSEFHYRRRIDEHRDEEQHSLGEEERIMLGSYRSIEDPMNNPTLVTAAQYTVDCFLRGEAHPEVTYSFDNNRTTELLLKVFDASQQVCYDL